MSLRIFSKTIDETYFSSGNKEADLVSLANCAYDIMELWKPEGDYNIKLREEWLKRAKELGAVPTW